MEKTILSPRLLLRFLALLPILAMWACNVESPAGTPVKEIRFTTIADSLRGAGYDHIQISATREGMAAPVVLYEAGLVSGTGPGLLTVPDSLGGNFTLTVKASQGGDKVFTKVYAIRDGALSGTPIVTPPPEDTAGQGGNRPRSVAVSPESLNLSTGGDTATVRASVLPESAPQGLAWSSSDAAVASVDALGLVRSGIAGKARITASSQADPAKSASVEVTVYAPTAAVTGVIVTPDTLRMYLGGPASALTASMIPAELPVLVNWRSSNVAVATVSADGKATATGTGTAVLTAYAKGDETKSDSCRVNVVKDVPRLSVGDDVSVAVGATVAFAPTVEQEYGGVAEFKWSLDGDTAWDGTAAEIPAGLSRKYDAPGSFVAYFLVKDGEGNTASAQRLIVVGGGDAPLVSIDSPRPGERVGSTPIVVRYKVNNVALQKSVDLIQGENTITVDTVVNGVRGSASVMVTLDTKAPVVKITAPASGTVTNKGSIAVAWSVDGAAQTGKVSETLSLEGENVIVREAFSAAGVKGADTVKVIRDTKNPVVLITSPAAGTITNKTGIAVAWTVDGAAQTAQLTEPLPLEGENIIKRVAEDAAGNKDSVSIKVIRNTQGAPVLITAPAEGTVTNKTSIAVAWTVGGKAQTAQLTEALTAEGVNLIIREAVDSLGNKSSDTVRVTRDTQPPVVAITSPAANAKVPSSPVTVAWTVDGTTQTAQTSEVLAAGDGEKTITRTATDAAGNTASASVKIILDKDKPAAPVMTAAVSPTNAASVVWKWTSGGNGNGTYRYRVDNPDLASGTTTVAAAQASVPSLADGTHTLYVQESDDQGNWSPSASQAILVDRTAPAIAIDGGNQTVAAAAFTVSAAVSDANGLASVAVAGAASGDGAMTLSAGKYSKAVTLASGANTLTVTAKDVAGNTKTASVVVTFTLPAIAITSPPDGFVTNNGSITVSYKVGSSPTVKTKPVVLADGAQTVTITEAGAQSASIQVYVYSNVIFVRKGAPAGGDGSSWDQAFNDLAAALASPGGKKSGNKLWVSAGTYINQDEASYGFHDVSLGVSLYGGFPATGRPFTEAGRKFTVDKTILACGVTWGGILRLAGNSTVDGFIFNQDVLGPEAVYVSISAIFSNCEFHGKNQPNDYIYVNGAATTFDKCVFSAAQSTGALINVFGGSAAISNSSFTGNSCRYLAYLDGQEISLSNTTINGNTSWDPDIAFPAFKIWNGSLRNLGGVVSDKPLNQP